MLVFYIDICAYIVYVYCSSYKGSAVLGREVCIKCVLFYTYRLFLERGRDTVGIVGKSKYYFVLIKSPPFGRKRGNNLAKV